MVRAGLKAGIIMGIVAAVFALIRGVMTLLEPELLPIAGPLQWCGWVVILALWFGAGILAARFTRATLTTGGAAGAGAVAGAITQVSGGIVDTLVDLVKSFLGFFLPGSIPPGIMQYLTDLGLSPQHVEALVGYTSQACMAVCGLLYAGVGAVMAAGLGALGGIACKAMKK